ncbi:MAG: 23S rRNA (adenine(2503)-C(2))-methyltransferase RlmN [Candidatus Buchananbacteria bacterium]
MNLSKLPEILKDEPKYRLQQVQAAIFHNLIDDWAKASNLSKALQEKLTKYFPLELDAKWLWDKPKTTAKVLIKLADGNQFEAVLMIHEKRNTVCLSSQIGCPLGCSFCATGQMGFKRNLTAEEIILPALLFARYLKQKNERIDSVVFMGMGEPFLNYDQVMKAIAMLNDADKFNIGARHISVSTVGLVPEIRKFAKEPRQINLAISLHAPTDELRSQIIPINKKYSIEMVLEAVKEYLDLTTRKVMIEYIMIKDFNDGAEQAGRLAEALSVLPRSLFMVNLIPYNITGKYQPSDEARIKKFAVILLRNKIRATVRQSYGPEVAGACGQLAGKKRNNRKFVGK